MESWIRPTFAASFMRSQLSSFLATAADYLVLFGLTEIFGVWYVTSVAIGAAVGAIAHFLLGRHWCFVATHGAWRWQAVRYGIVSLGSLILNCLGVYAVTEYLLVPYAISVVLISIIVGIFFNFPLHRHFVFH